MSPQPLFTPVATDTPWRVPVTPQSLHFTPISSDTWRIPVTPQSLFTPMPLPARIHSAIAYTGIAPPLGFDLAYSPKHIIHTPSLSSGRSSVFSPSFARANSVLYESAVCPGSPCITLLTEALPWSIIAAAKSGVVTNYDVLRAIHKSLRRPITQTEWASLSSVSQNMISLSFHKRVEGFPDRVKRDKQFGKGVRRLDFLAEHTRLLGISQFGEGLDVYRIHWDFGGP